MSAKRRGSRLMNDKIHDRIVNCTLFKSGDWFSSRDMVAHVKYCKSETEAALRSLAEDGLVTQRKEFKSNGQVTYYKSCEAIRGLVRGRLSKGPAITYADAHINPWIYHDIKRSENEAM